jgi:hypothetical protein
MCHHQRESPRPLRAESSPMVTPPTQSGRAKQAPTPTQATQTKLKNAQISLELVNVKVLIILGYVRQLLQSSRCAAFVHVESAASGPLASPFLQTPTFSFHRASRVSDEVNTQPLHLLKQVGVGCGRGNGSIVVSIVLSERRQCSRCPLLQIS